MGLAGHGGGKGARWSQPAESKVNTYLACTGQSQFGFIGSTGDLLDPAAPCGRRSARSGSSARSHSSPDCNRTSAVAAAAAAAVGAALIAANR